MYAQNLNSCPSVEKTSQDPVPILNQEHNSTLPLTVYGEALSSVPILMSESLTPMLHLTDTTQTRIGYTNSKKKRAYEQRIREVEHSSFTPLVLSATGGLAREVNTFYKRLALCNWTKHTAARYAGYDVAWPSPSYAHAYKPLEGRDPPVDTPSDLPPSIS